MNGREIADAVIEAPVITSFTRFGYEARRRLTEAGLRRLTIWCLTENRPGCRFYRRLGGTVTASARGGFGGVLVEKTAFSWA